jgi:hypothetical protein
MSYLEIMLLRPAEPADAMAVAQITLSAVFAAQRIKEAESGG